MGKKVLSILLSLMMLIGASLVVAGGAPVAPGCGPYAGGPCASGPYAGGPYGSVAPPYSNYWGDAPFPGLCGGVVALPFLVVGSLLGGNTVAPPPYAAPGVVGYNCAPRPCPPSPCAPMPQPMPRPYSVSCAPTYGCAPGGGSGGGSVLGLPCLDVCAGLLGAVTGGVGLMP
jgi:hypothetical protein